MCACKPGFYCHAHRGVTRWDDHTFLLDQDSGQMERIRENNLRSEHTFETPWRNNDT